MKIPLQQDLTRPQIRRLLSACLPTDGDRRAFLVDYFPGTAEGLSDGMDAKQQITRLFEHHSVEKILNAIEEAAASDANLGERLLRALRAEGLQEQSPIETHTSTGSLIALGPDIIAYGELLGTSAQKWNINLREPFVLGDLSQLSRFGEDFEALLLSDRYILVEALNVGRTLASHPSWKRENGHILIDVDVETQLPRANINKLNDVNPSNFEHITGIDVVPRFVERCLRTMKGSWGLSPEYGSRIAEYQFRLKPVKELMQRLIKTEIIRNAYVPRFDRMVKREVASLDFVERVEHIQLIEYDIQMDVIQIDLQLKLHGSHGVWSGKVRVPLSTEDHWHKTPAALENRLHAEFLKEISPPGKR